MAKALFYRWFGVGRFPPAMMPQARSEGILFLDEGVRGVITYRNFHRPGKRAALEKRLFVGAIVLTNVRLFAVWGNNKLVDVPLDDARLKQMQLAVEDGAFVIRFDAGLFHNDWSGSVEYKFKSDESQRLLDLLHPHLS
ncbi:MAG TPA: hypothetical protein VGI80_08900 [Pyrinomonadaceae bacterium]|jgi:hypothetical protein